MRTTIVALFDSEQSAADIEAQIRQEDSIDGQLETVTWRELAQGKSAWEAGKVYPGRDEQRPQLVDHLRELGVPDDDARDFAEAVRRGGNLVVSEVDDDRSVDEVAELMHQREAVDLEQRRAQWQAQGHRGYDPNSPIYSADQVADERQRVREFRQQSARRQSATADQQPPVDIDELTDSLDPNYDYSTYRPKFRQHFDSSFARKGGDFADYEPAYRYGHAFGSDARDTDRSYEDVESAMRRCFEAEHGEDSFTDYRGAARHAYNSAQRRLYSR